MCFKHIIFPSLLKIQHCSHTNSLHTLHVPMHCLIEIRCVSFLPMECLLQYIRLQTEQELIPSEEQMTQVSDRLWLVVPSPIVNPLQSGFWHNPTPLYFPHSGQNGSISGVPLVNFRYLFLTRAEQFQYKKV